MDQGAFLQFYEDEIKGKPINKVMQWGRSPYAITVPGRLPHLLSTNPLSVQIFNYKIYHPFRRTARIVHMHG